MPVPTTNVTLSSLQTEYGGANPILMSEYYRGGSNVPSGQTSTNGTIPTLGAITMGVFRGTTKVATITFTPTGGASAGAAVFLQSDVAFEEGEIVISCSQNATWNYTRTFTSGSGTEFVSLASGGVGTSIIFRCNGTFGTLARRTWSVNGTAGGITQYWTVDIRSEYV